MAKQTKEKKQTSKTSKKIIIQKPAVMQQQQKPEQKPTKFFWPIMIAAKGKFNIKLHRWIFPVNCSIILYVRLWIPCSLHSTNTTFS